MPDVSQQSTPTQHLSQHNATSDITTTTSVAGRSLQAQATEHNENNSITVPTTNQTQATPVSTTNPVISSCLATSPRPMNRKQWVKEGVTIRGNLQPSAASNIPSQAPSQQRSLESGKPVNLVYQTQKCRLYDYYTPDEQDWSDQLDQQLASVLHNDTYSTPSKRPITFCVNYKLKLRRRRDVNLHWARPPMDETSQSATVTSNNRQSDKQKTTK